MTANAQFASAQRTAHSAPHTATMLVGLVDGRVALLRADTGATVWRKWVGGEITGLAHGGDTVYLAISSPKLRPDIRPLRPQEPFPPPPLMRDANGDPIYERDPTGRREYHIRTEQVDILFDLARIEARRAADGALLWSFINTSLPNRAGIALAGETLAVWAPQEYILFGLDARTGARRWRRAFTPHDEATPDSESETDGDRVVRSPEQIRVRNVLGTRDGQLYAEVLTVSFSADAPGSMRGSHRTAALDAASGALRWSHMNDPHAQSVLLSRGGALVLDIGRASANGRVLTARRAEDGSLVGTLTYQGELRGVSDDGVAYVTEGDQDGHLRALRISSDTPDGSASQEAALGTPGAIIVTHAIHNPRDGRDTRIIARALDTATGATRWTWRSPKNLAALLRLWGLRAPGAFSASVIRQARKYGPALPKCLRYELASGQWRHPAEMFVMRVHQAEDAVYLGGRLGVFALRASDGAHLWSGLPNVEVDTRLPLLISPS